jgi:hypothetical protein
MQTYIAVSKLHGLVLDVQRGGTAPGTLVIPWHKGGGDNQQWYDDPATGTIRSKLNGFCLDIEGDGALRLMPYQPGDPNQQWERDIQGGYIRNRVNRNRVLDIFNIDKTPGAKIGCWDANGGHNQLWTFEGPGAVPAAGGYSRQQPGYPQPGVYPQPGQQTYPGQGGYKQAAVQRREFFIVSDLHGKVIDVKAGNQSPGTPVIMWTKNSPPSKNQLWYADPQGFIRATLNDFALDAQSGQNVHLQPFNGGATQQWVVEGNTVKNRSNGDVLDIIRGNKDNGAELCSYKNNNSPNQHWHVEYV